MARQTDRLVDEIRARRADLRGRLEAMLSLEDVGRSVRRNPAAWIAGGALAGILVGRLWGGPLLQAGRRRVAAGLRGQAQTALAALLLAGLGRRRGPHPGPDSGPALDPGARPEPRS